MIGPKRYLYPIPFFPALLPASSEHGRLLLQTMALPECEPIVSLGQLEPVHLRALS